MLRTDIYVGQNCNLCYIQGNINNFIVFPLLSPIGRGNILYKLYKTILNIFMDDSNN